MQTIEEALEKLKASKFRSGFSLKEKEKAYVRKKEWIQFDATHRTLSGRDLRLLSFRMMESRRLCMVIRYLLLSMHAPAVVGGACKNGTVFPKVSR